MHYDVAIIGGGPGGSTTAGFLRMYDPDCKVLILEREKFPRDHVGESQLPPISRILNELGCWDKVEAANFPIKIGASYRWGRNPEVWDFEFIPRSTWVDEPRPAKYEGQRLWTAFQVDRAIYDDILLRHAEELGTEVREETKVVSVERDGDKVTGLVLSTGETVTADVYIDASGDSGIMRRAMGVEIKAPTLLQNIAIWDYYQNAEWAVEIGVGATLIQVLSLSYGWFWFIPLGPTRTSIGFITSAKYYKESGLRPEELFNKALSEDPTISKLIANAIPEGKLQTTKDWSFIAEQMTGENWMLVGECSGFADPILSAGLSLAQTAAREAAFTILEKRRGELDWEWLRSQYEKGQSKRIDNHIRFADYWYSSNAQFKDLQDFTTEIASSNGLDLSPEKAWAWIAQGGFIDEELAIGVAGFSLDQIKEFGNHLSELAPAEYVANNNIFRLDLLGAKETVRATYAKGRVGKCPCYERDGKVLPLLASTDLVTAILRNNTHRPMIERALREIAERYKNEPLFIMHILMPFEITLEAMISDGWVKAYHEPSIPMTSLPNNMNVHDWLAAGSVV